MADSSREIDDQVDFEDDNYEEVDDDVEEEEEGPEGGDDEMGEEHEDISGYHGKDHDEDRNQNQNQNQNQNASGHVDDEEKKSPFSREDNKKHTELLALPPHGSEIFIGGLPKDVVEEDLTDLCEPFGDVVEVRLVKNRDTNEIKGFAFVAFRTKDVAQKAIEELHNKEFKGRTIRCSLSETKYRLFIGNVPKSWTDDDFRKVIEETGPGSEVIELIKDPQNPPRNRGFAFVEYYNNACADYSRQKLASANFKLDGNTPTVTWADPKSTPDHSAAAQVKALYVKNIPENTSTEHLKELFQRHGEVIKVVMPPAKAGGKRDFGFVHFAERSSALKAVKDGEKYEVEGQFLEVVLAKPQSDRKSDNISPHYSGPHPNYIPQNVYGGFSSNPYGGSVGPRYGVTPSFQQPMIYGRGPVPGGMQMVPMVLPDGQIGYVLQQPGAQMPAARPPRRNERSSSNGSGGARRGGGGSGGGGGGVAVRQEPKFEYPLAGNAPTRPATTPVSQFPGGSSASYAARFSESSNVGVNSGPSPNAWGPRKVAGITEPVAASWSAPDAATKLAHASALEKVSSGRWLSNQHKQVDVEVIRHPEPEAKVQTKGNMYTTPEAARSWTTNEVVPPVAPREVPRTDVVQDLQPSEVSERPKLKLLPRSKPVENLEPLVAYKQAIPQAGEAGMVDTGNESYGNANATEDGNQGFDRPRVNLKPRSQPIEQMERNTDRERNSLFGGARPRELVLKERGVDDVAVNHDTIQSPPNRAKKEITRADNPPVTSRQNGKPEPLDHHRTASKTRDHVEKSDAQRRSNWRNENRKIEKQPPPPPTPQERPPSPETWRKPVEPTPPVGPRYGKAASAVELAQAFSKSVSDPKVGLRGVPGQGQIPFSRLTGQPATRPHQINGH